MRHETISLTWRLFLILRQTINEPGADAGRPADSPTGSPALAHPTERVRKVCNTQQEQSHILEFG